MGKFLKAEKILQANVKINSSYFSDNARADGFYKNYPTPFVFLANTQTKTSLQGFAAQR